MSRSLVLASALALSALAAPRARADLWREAIANGAPDPAKDTYESELRDGDDHLLLANSKHASRTQVKEQLRLAIQSYRAAAAAQPKAAEPYFRIADALHSFYLETCGHQGLGISPSPLRDCRHPDRLDPEIMKQTIAAWDAAEARAPLDPRFSPSLGGGLLFQRALLHTKLATRAHFEASARDYEKILARADLGGRDLESTWGNLAETYMMLGRLEDAIAAYVEACRQCQSVSTVYGLAVALDRDGRTAKAHDLMSRYRQDGYEKFVRSVREGDTFFVPHGEVFYYLALAEESLGMIDAALEHFKLFIASGAHPQYHARAREHIDDLLAKKRAGVPPTPPPDPFWKGR